ncbi:MAG TPA: ABC transporter substrate-binding protein [Burkholderiales bacterium]|jgi:multiple sugar transport system substrate-binding protein|nr:ABC transporter substrate-binding protein [Burkholderiales bacterium]
MLRKLFAAAALGAFAVAFSLGATAQETLVVYWTKGFYPQEDKALDDMVAKFQKKTGVKIELSRYSPQESVPKAVAALDSGTPPDVAYGDVFDFQVAGKWAAEGRLEDLSDILTPMKASFLPVTLETVYLLNEKTGKRGYYAFPMKRQTMHIQYWKDMLAQAGFKEGDIPKTWNAYWDFWCTKAQAGYRKASGQRIFSVGAPMGVDSSDSFYSFLTYMDAHNVKVVDDNGKLTVDQPEVKKGLVATVADYSSTVAKGCTPPTAVTWKDPDNNVAFHNKQIMMTHNATISIAAKWLDDANNEKLKPEERAQAKKNYEELIATGAFPAKPDGKPMQYRSAVKVGVVFANAKNKKRAKEFVQFAMQDENLIPYVEGALGRWYPVTKSGASRKFWTEDPHRKIVHEQFSAGTVPFEFTKNWKFTILNNENVWAKAVNRVVVDKWTPEKAVDEMIARIKQVAG